MTQPATRVSAYIALNESQSYWRWNKNYQWPFPFCFAPRYLVVPGGCLTSREPTTKRQKCRTEVVEKGWGLALKASQRAQAIFSSSEPAPGIPKSEHRTILNLIYSHPPMAATDLSHFFSLQYTKQKGQIQDCSEKFETWALRSILSFTSSKVSMLILLEMWCEGRIWIFTSLGIMMEVSLTLRLGLCQMHWQLTAAVLRHTGKLCDW